MKIGLMTPAFPELSLETIAKWSSENNFKTLEIACWPAGEGKDRKYGGVVHIDVDTLDNAKASEINGMLKDYGLEISALGYYPNPLHPDPSHREHVVNHLKKVISAAGMLNVGIVGTFLGRSWNFEKCGRDWKKDLDYNFEEVKKTWPDILSAAEDNNVKIAIEHCPMLWADTWPGGSNLPHSPALLNRLFETLPNDSIGINLDPSHFVWQQIDYIRFIDDFREKIFHVHAKDMAIDEEMFYQDGILGNGFRWQIPRLPGQGLIDWRELISALYDAGYNYVLSIEHEDRNWEGTEELVKEGFLLARKALEIYTV